VVPVSGLACSANVWMEWPHCVVLPGALQLQKCNACSGHNGGWLGCCMLKE
jgi:hypothetical protein